MRHLNSERLGSWGPGVQARTEKRGDAGGAGVGSGSQPLATVLQPLVYSWEQLKTSFLCDSGPTALPLPLQVLDSAGAAPCGPDLSGLH